MKKVLSIFLAITIMASSFAFNIVNAKTELTDITGHFAQESIELLVEKGVITGYPDKSFRPDDSITRAEFAVILSRAFNFSDRDEIITGEISYSDVPKDNFYYDCITDLSKYGIVKGDGTGKFNPDEKIMRQDMSLMIARIHLDENEISSYEDYDNGFPDKESVADYAKGAVNFCIKNKIINGDDGKIAPADNATRGQTCVIITRFHRYLESLIPTNDKTDDLTSDTSDETTNEVTSDASDETTNEVTSDASDETTNEITQEAEDEPTPENEFEIEKIPFSHKYNGKGIKISKAPSISVFNESEWPSFTKFAKSKNTVEKMPEYTFAYDDENFYLCIKTFDKTDNITPAGAGAGADGYYFAISPKGESFGAGSDGTYQDTEHAMRFWCERASGSEVDRGITHSCAAMGSKIPVSSNAQVKSLVDCRRINTVNGAVWTAKFPIKTFFGLDVLKDGQFFGLDGIYYDGNENWFLMQNAEINSSGDIGTLTANIKGSNKNLTRLFDSVNDDDIVYQESDCSVICKVDSINTAEFNYEQWAAFKPFAEDSAGAQPYYSVVYDSNNLYLAVKTRDGNTNNGLAGLGGDGLELFFSGDGSVLRKQSVEKSEYGAVIRINTTMKGSDSVQLISKGGKIGDVSLIDYTLINDRDKTMLITVPWKFFGKEVPYAGRDSIGINMKYYNGKNEFPLITPSVIMQSNKNIFIFGGRSLYAPEKLNLPPARIPVSLNMQSKKDGTFKILQITDIHVTLGSEEKTLNNLFTVTENEKPDLIVITGDALFERRNGEAARKLLYVMERLHTPWTYTFGNHDCESGTEKRKEEIYSIFENGLNYVKGDEMLDKNGAVIKTNQSYGNHSIKIKSSNGKKIPWQIMIMDNGTGVESGHVTWFKDVAYKADAETSFMTFAHIPFNQFNSANRIGVKYEFTPIGDNNLYQTMLNSGKHKAMFVGHDHWNDYIAYTDNMFLGFGRTADFTCYNIPGGGHNLARGGRVIILNDNTPGEFITYNSTTSEPAEYKTASGKNDAYIKKSDTHYIIPQDLSKLR